LPRAAPLPPDFPVTPIISAELPARPSPLRQRITAATLRDETEHLEELLPLARLPEAEQAAVQATAVGLVERTRVRAADPAMVEAFMREYDLSSEEGVLLMCVAEALLRIPDQDTANRLIRDKLGDADWDAHVGKSTSTLVNASTWGLMLTGRLVTLAEDTRRDAGGAFKRLVGRMGEPAIRLAVRQAMRIMGHQFVMGRTIGEALERSRKGDNARYRYSFDMLGEGAFTAADAARYLQAYRDAIAAIGAGGPYPDVFAAPSISVKLSALHPRYEFNKRERVLAELVPRIVELARLAKSHGIGFTIDAEESERLELSLDVIAAAYEDPSLAGWEGYGLAVQAYQKRAPFVLDFLVDLARRVGRRMPVRLVKGAYWDSEIKKAQTEGLPGYPVFTRKPNTDVSYLACARKMLAATDAFVSNVRHAQRADDRRDPPVRDGPRVGSGAGNLTSTNASMAWASTVRRDDRPGAPRRPLPRLRARWFARRTCCPYLGAPPAGERRELQLRQSASPTRRRLRRRWSPIRSRPSPRSRPSRTRTSRRPPPSLPTGRIPWA
jgi:RHH-type proline utilization regulon transcriptional repressor/proline dehydrogenase/delta 1-pyrroline-5-carboxylate dehydrogenase